jgi:hypothetical protein
VLTRSRHLSSDLAQLSLTAKRLRRRREEQEEGPGKSLGACIASFVSLRFSLVSLCFETALCLNTTTPFINTLAPLRESYTLTPITD